MVNVKLCKVVLVVDLYLRVPFSVTVTISEGHHSVKQFELKVLCSCPVRLKLCMIFNYVDKIVYIQ